jgi:hypothetical protein
LGQVLGAIVSGKAIVFQSEGGFWNSCILDKENYSLEFTIFQPASVDLPVGDMFFNSSQDEEDDDSTPVTKANAMKLVQLHEAGFIPCGDQERPAIPACHRPHFGRAFIPPGRGGHHPTSQQLQ